ncbi:MAG: SMP-30/gluconolactonase/LRE family protein [Phycisphaerales bacterium]|nr:MAG: SMP-30/gluconolactonase/LRE family protein [Phycisphaerales bacterium]
MSVRYAVLCVTPLAFVTAGCDPPALTPTGVRAVFGTQGLGPGAFVYPRAIAVGPDRGIYVVDKSARVQRFSPEGEFETLWNMPQRKAGKPVGIWVGPDGRVYVADTHYSRVIVYDRDGRELARFGQPGTGDGEFMLPTDVVVDADGFIYVSEYNGNDRITRWSPDYKFVSVVVAGKVAGQALARPAAMDIDAEQTLWVVDACNHRILRLDCSGRLLACFGEMGEGAGQMRYPYDISVTPQGTIMVCEYGNSRLQWFAMDGTPLGTWGSRGRKLGQLWAPWGAAVGSDGNICIVDSLNSRIQIVRP